MFFSACAASLAVRIPASITEYWVAGRGMYQDVAMTSPVTAAGQNIAKWVGRRLGTELTETASGAVVAQLVDGLLVPKFTATGAEALTLPAGFAVDRRNVSILMHVQRPGVFQTRAFYGIGTTGRQLELDNFADVRLLTYDGTTSTYTARSPLASACTVSLRASASSAKVGVNGTETSNAAYAAGSLVGGRIGNLNGVNVASLDRVYGIAIAELLNDTDYSDSLTYLQSIKSIPSETVPTENWAVFGDSNTEGTNTDSLTSWLTKFVDNYPSYRIFPIVGSGQSFNVGGSPQNNATTTAQIAIEKRASAGKNRVIFCTTNDFNNVANGSDYFAAVKALGQTLMSLGWEAWVMKFPGRTTPYTTTDTTYNANVAQFNALCVSDPWMTGTMDCSAVVPGEVDGVHWNDANQLTIYNTIKSAFGI